MIDDWDEFLGDYDAKAADVGGAGYSEFEPHLSRWFAHVEASPDTRNVLQSFERKVNRAQWFNKLKERESAGQGTPPPFPWSKDEATYLGQRITLMRSFAEGGDLHNFVVNYMYEPNQNSNSDAVHRITQRVFSPMARDLRRALRKRLFGASPPSPDSLVTIDHEGEDFSLATKTLGEVEIAVETVNDLEDNDRNRVLMELAAGRQLLNGREVRVTAATVVLGGALIFLMGAFPDFGVGVAAHAAWDAIRRLLQIGNDD